MKGGRSVKGSPALRLVAVGIGSEDFHKTALVAQFLDGAGDLGVVGVALDVAELDDEVVEDEPAVGGLWEGNVEKKF